MLENFKTDLSRVESETTVYVGRLEDSKAICVVPHKVVNKDEFNNLLTGSKTIIQQNDIYTTYSITSPTSFNLRLVHPAEEKHIKKYLGQYKFITESYEEYLIKRENMKSVPWIDNIIVGTTSEKIYYSDSEFVIVSNFKWNGVSNDDLQLLLIFKDKNLKTLREIESEDVLIRVKEVIKRELKGFVSDFSDIIVYFHYPPTYDQLHLHITNCNIDCSSATFVGRAKLLDDVIYSLSLDRQFYKSVVSGGARRKMGFKHVYFT